ncbi:unannotated protein [freshwater metagenome]|uniref:Unannotated protein n=1 Tax=freshwater metagenome TaxID=449393 RepID=A0A6J6IJ67_9ZZZZ
MTEIADIRGATQSCERSRYRRNDNDDARWTHTGVTGSGRSSPDYTHLVSEAGSSLQDSQPGRSGDPEQKPERNHKRTKIEVGPPCDRRNYLPLWKHCTGAVEFTPQRLGFEDQVGGNDRCDVIQHQRGDDLVRFEIGTEDARDGCPETAADGTGDNHRQNRHPGGKTFAERKRNAGGEDRSHVELTFTADVEESDLECHRRAQSGEEKRSCRHQRSTQGPLIEKTPFEYPLVGRQWILSGDEEHNRTDEQRCEERTHGDSPHEPAGTVGSRFEANPESGEGAHD